jgi:hypothetical protein
VGALRSLRLRLVVVLTGVVACAMGVVFLYVVPSLRQNLIADRQAHLELIARGQQNAHGLTNAFSSGEHVRKALLHAARIANGSATGYIRQGGRYVPAGGTRPVLAVKNRIVSTALHGGIGHGRTPGGGIVVAFSVNGARAWCS